ncbi:MAG: tyrosine-type recombinase/integrase [Theionarchaea archaeon]|nr:tyrosine-type recombinase/integrase [Theionarchaea archaeon]
MLCEKERNCMKEVEEFRKFLELKGYSEVTITSYLGTIQRFLKEINKNVNEITLDVVNEFFSYLKSNDCGNSTICSYGSAIKAFLKFIDNEIHEKIILPKLEKKLPVVLTKEEVNKLFECVSSKRSLCTLRLLYATGIRVSEIVNLDRRDIEDLRVLVRSGKGKKDRIVYMDENTSNLIKKYLSERKDDIPALFVNNKGKRISQRSVQIMVKNTAKRAGINKKVTPHTLRHTFATHMLENRANIVVIKDLLGHASLSTTQIYTHVSDEYKKKAYEESHPLSKMG